MRTLLAGRCADTPSGSTGDFDHHFQEDWDRITFAGTGVQYRDVAAETNTVFDDALLDRRPSLSVVVLQRYGEAIAAYEFEDPLVEIRGGHEMFSMDAPGTFTREGSTCIVGV